VNFVIINLAPGDPVSVTEISQEGGAARRESRSMAFSGDERYLQFREFYGLTLPILVNTWPWLSLDYVKKTLWQLTYRRQSEKDPSEIPLKQYEDLRVKFGDQARFILPHLVAIIENPTTSSDIKRLAVHFFARGGSRPGYVGAGLTSDQKAWNKKVSEDNQLLRSLTWTMSTSNEEVDQKIQKLKGWYKENASVYQFEPHWKDKLKILFLETRFSRYMGRLLRLDFGTLRNDPNKTVVSEVVKRFKYSLTLAILPLFVTFFLCLIFGFIMAYYQGRWPDYLLNLLFLVLYAIPIFVVAPFLIEKIALHHHFPFTNTPIPLSGFTSPDRTYAQMTSYQRLLDILNHLALPLIAIMYGSLAAESRLSRTAVLEVLRQDYVRTAWAKGVPPMTILVKHVGRNAAVTIVTSIASSLGVVLGGSLIVETLFDINGFGKFFYEAVINRDYNVIMFSAFAGSFLTLVGYLVADLAYMWLDPRITLE
jgi:peptide/nickel transport system permease protein